MFSQNCTRVYSKDSAYLRHAVVFTDVSCVFFLFFKYSVVQSSSRKYEDIQDLS